MMKTCWDDDLYGEDVPKVRHSVDRLVEMAISGLRFMTIGKKMGLSAQQCRYKWNEVATPKERELRRDANYHISMLGEEVAIERPRLLPGESGSGFPASVRFTEERIVEYGRVPLPQTVMLAVSTAASEFGLILSNGRTISRRDDGSERTEVRRIGDG